MAISNVFEKLGRAVFESPFAVNKIAKDAPELAEIRLAALDAVKATSHRVGGKNVFARDLVRIELLGIPEEQQAIFRSEFLANYFAEELKAALIRSSFRFSPSLAVEFRTLPRLPAQGERWLSVETAMQEPPPAGSEPAPGAPAFLTVLSGTTNQAKFSLRKVRTNIGRTAEVFRAASPSRRNDLVFLGENEADKTVSREHAHIVRSVAKREYRLFNDRNYRGESNCGLWIVRDGLSYPVHRGARGTLLLPGDEIHIGAAVLRFSLEKR
jgi:hypothetical protein